MATPSASIFLRIFVRSTLNQVDEGTSTSTAIARWLSTSYRRRLCQSMTFVIAK